MAQKIASHIISLIPYFPSISTSFKHLCGLYSSKPSYTAADFKPLQRFLHAWCLVNTRCFYYHPPPPLPGSHLPAPSNTNESMALCPGMDLFNHSTDTNNCRVKYDQTGYTITAQRSYKTDEEVCLSYGRHGNDTLWVEYGFFLDGLPSPPPTPPISTSTSNGERGENINVYDEVCFDSLLLPKLSASEKDFLKSRDYLGNYNLHYADGASSTLTAQICHRTYIYAHVLALRDRNDLLTQGNTYDRHFAQLLNGRIEHDSLGGKIRNAVNDTITALMDEVATAANENVAALNRLDDDEQRLITSFGTTVLAGCKDGHDDAAQLNLARRRRDVCVRRWQQIGHLADAARVQYVKD